MHAPIYLPESTVSSPTVSAVERAIMEAEGAFHVDGRYYANEDDARQERRRLAERRVRENDRRTAYGECARGRCDGAARFRLSTWISARERQQVDAGAVECVRTIHRESLAEVVADLTSGDVDGALVSAAYVGPESLPALTAGVRGFPAQLVVGLIGEVEYPAALAASLLFGQAGVRVLADVRNAEGWRQFRNIFDCGRQPDPFIRQALAAVFRDIAEDDEYASTGRNEFFRLVFSARVTSAKEVSRELRVLPSTLMSRFFRAGLPSPKRYVACARLVWAAHLAEAPAMSFAAIADRLNASSSQSFHRTVRMLVGMSAAEFRHAFNGATMFERFRLQLVTPYRDTLRTFDPLADTGGIVRPRGTSAVRHQAASARQGRAA